MKFVVAYLRPTALEPVLRALAEHSVRSVAFSEVRGYGRQKEHLDAYRPGVLGYAFLPRIRFTFAVEASECASAIAAVTSCAYTGSIGDGKILILDVAEGVAA